MKIVLDTNVLVSGCRVAGCVCHRHPGAPRLVGRAIRKRRRGRGQRQIAIANINVINVRGMIEQMLRDFDDTGEMERRLAVAAARAPVRARQK